MDDAVLNRARGVLLGTAAGDALGAPYEFGPPLGPEVEVGMIGGGNFGWARGEWTDDTSMAIVIAQQATTGSLLDERVQDRIVARWTEWAATAKDIGNQTSAVLGAARASTGDATAAAQASRTLHERTGHTGGNGALMRTAPVTLAYLASDADEDALVRAATGIGALTHWDPESGEACALWCLAIRHAVLTGEVDVRVGLPRLPADRRGAWATRIEAAEASRPADFERNGWVVEAFQAAWSAIAMTQKSPARLEAALDAAVRGGRDTDTVAAIAGGLIGAGCGESTIPASWLDLLHGWPGLRAEDLRALTDAIVTR